MTLTEQKVAAKKFATKWADRGDEKQDTRLFWEEFMEDVLGIEGARDIIHTEYPVDINGHQKYIDIYYQEKEILIEQKSSGKALNKRYRQSGGDMLTPFEQGRRYAGYLRYGENTRWIIACNFQQFEIHDLKKPGEAPIVVELSDLEKQISIFRFFVSDKNEDIQRETQISKDAGEVVGRLYDALKDKYVDPEDEKIQRDLNILVTRLVFCMYAEDAGLFGDEPNRFQNYIKSKDPDDVGEALERLFRILDMPEDKRSKKSNIPSALRAFPYVNGGLFEEEDLEIPLFDDELKKILVEDACAFNWSDISPTIFGAVFESTLNPETRRAGGMHYTSIENIHKVIDPLFLNQLEEEYRSLQATAEQRGYKSRLQKFQDKLASFSFLDPACGSGNFLTESYLSLRRLENRAIAERFSGQQAFGDVFEENPIRVSIDQFYGIEINDFAVTVARTALWIAEAQMLEETEEIIRSQIEFFPLKTNAYIVEGNALQMEWDKVVAKDKLNFIMGNPPFVGYAYQSKSQKEDLHLLYPNCKNIDYVAGWFAKATEMMESTSIRCAFVSTNSITQGEQVSAVWKPLYDRYNNLHFDFAYRTFQWDSEASIKAHVHCVIIGFSLNQKPSICRIYDGDMFRDVDCINPYLTNADTMFISKRKKPLGNVPEMVKGSSPVDGGFFFISEEEYANSTSFERQYIRPFVGAREFLHGQRRWCLWLEGVEPSVIAASTLLKEHVQGVKEFRENSSKEATRRYAEKPTLFMEIRQPSTDYILVPRHSSQNRRYIPLGFMGPDTICGDANNMIPYATKALFGILESNVHMAWMRTVCGRIKSDYRYSNDIVYNNFPWPTLTLEQQQRIEATAQKILDVRDNYSHSTLADLYDETLMPYELRRAHQENDIAVMEAYELFHLDESGKKRWYSEEETIAALMKMYQQLVQPKDEKPKKATVKIKVKKTN